MDEQERMKKARTHNLYSEIWQNTGKCVFCDLKDKYIIYEENEIVLTINLYPYIDGQLMAIPRKHIQSPRDLTPDQWETVRKFNYIAKKMVKKIHAISSLWTLIREGGDKAQMTVSDHLHVQFIPFDDKDLCTWNFRELQHAPLKNVALYQKEIKEIKRLLERFEEKYS